MFQIGRSSNGRTGAFEALNLGPIPSLPANKMNTKVLLRTVIDIERLKKELKDNHFEFEFGEEVVYIKVQSTNLNQFENIIKSNLNALWNYANVKFSDQKTNIVIFPDRTFIIINKETDIEAKRWATSIGLPQQEAEWTTFYE